MEIPQDTLVYRIRTRSRKGPRPRHQRDHLRDLVKENHGGFWREKWMENGGFMGFYGGFMVVLWWFYGIYPQVICCVATERSTMLFRLGHFPLLSEKSPEGRWFCWARLVHAYTCQIYCKTTQKKTRNKDCLIETYCVSHCITDIFFSSMSFGILFGWS